MKQLLKKLPVSKSTVYQWVKDGKFPAPTVKLSERCVMWDLEDVQKFIKDASGK
jgi:prophage regulatory protein